MEDAVWWFGILGPAFFFCGFAVRREHRKNMKLAADGDDKAVQMMRRWRTTEALLGPVLIVMGICMTLGTFLADYQEAGSSSSAEPSIEKLLKALPK